MGQTQSSLPSGKNYKYSYCKQLNNLPYVNLPPILNLSHLIFLPKTKNKYIGLLVVVDLGTKQFDIQPIINNINRFCILFI